MYDKVNMAEFCISWQNAENVKQLDMFGLTPAETSRLAAMLRKKGVPLKKFREPVKFDVDVKALNKAIGVK